MMLTRMMLFSILLLIAKVCASKKVQASLEFLSEFEYPKGSGQALRVCEVHGPDDSETTKKIFVHDPAIIPSATCSNDPQNLVCCTELPKGNAKCSLRLILSSPEIRKEAENEVLFQLANSKKTKGVELASSLGSNFVKCSPMELLLIDETRFAEYFQYEVRVQDTEIPLKGGQDDAYIHFILPSMAYSSRFNKDISKVTINYKYLVEGSDLERNKIQIKWEHLINSPLHVALSGTATADSVDKGQRVAYVHRDDLRTLVYASVKALSVESWIESSSFANKVFDLFLQLFPKDDTALFTEAMWNHTYNKNDLRPDQVKKFAWEKADETERSAASSSDADLEFASADWFSKSSFGFSFSEEESSHFREKHDVKLVKEGNIWVPRSLLVRRVNLNFFNSSGSLLQTEVIVRNASQWVPGIIDMERSVAPNLDNVCISSNAFQDLSDLKAVLLSKSAVLTWSGPKDTIPKGWKICDGQNGALDARSRVLRGAADGEAAGSHGGTDSTKLGIENMVEHDHCVGGYCYLSASISPHSWKPSYHQAGDGRMIEDRGQAAKVGESKPFPNIPSYTAVLFLCRA